MVLKSDKEEQKHGRPAGVHRLPYSFSSFSKLSQSHLVEWSVKNSHDLSL